MDEQVERLAQKVWGAFQSTEPAARYMVGISGIPGSGKTSLATAVVHRLNTMSPSPVAACIAMDGYHLTRAQLSAMPDPVIAFARRGAAFTFDPTNLIVLINSLRDPLTTSSPVLYAPSFDHAVKDPVENDIPIPPTARILLFEGNYLALNKKPWNDAAALLDELWFVEVDFEVARQRLIKRHVRAGIAKDEEEADKRARENDLVNGREIVDNRLPVAEIVISKEDAHWKTS
ncbi:Aim12p [Nannizzia gypsea CBS 118893]|uniref:Aim12p n=1 Tax=Arthroderma gypseum (strain ATCC MYA-4604 / CBS 118893) TaxID=535722 RepID=E5R3Z4_ARTGP|nr:Aim12p [Nannizzia gypsea CBS 118893]EFQ98840.1 Aim12p [Nannizzia gypsea CBS 118893]